jgi:hypothetical protein
VVIVRSEGASGRAELHLQSALHHEMRSALRKPDTAPISNVWTGRNLRLATSPPLTRPMNDIIRDVFALSPDVRYVAIYLNGRLEMASRAAANASSEESDRYEELIVNPTLLTLARQRGEIDCGGLAFLLVRYGHFYQLILPVGSGHVSVSIEPTDAPLALLDGVRAAVQKGLAD